MPSLQPIGGTIRLNPSAGGAATVVPLAQGGFAAVYRVANGPDVFRLFGGDFAPLGDEITVTTDDVLAPQATALSDGRFVVAWLAQDQTVHAQMYTADGSVSGGSVTLVTPTDAMFGVSEPRLVATADSGFVAIWQDNAAINGVTGVLLIQSYDSTGAPLGDPVAIAPPAAGPADQSSIADFRLAVLTDGTMIVAALVQINGVASIVYSVNGGPLITLAGGDSSFIYANPQITRLAGDGYVITYDFVDPTLVGTDSPDANWTTGGSVFTSHGSRHDFAIGTTVTTSSTGTFAVDPSVITPLSDGGFVVTFEPLTSPLGDGYLVDAQQFSAFGKAVGPVVLVAPQGFLPNIATSSNGVVLETFQFGSGVFLRALQPAPTPWGPEGEGASFGLNAVVSANSPGVAPLFSGGFVVVYQSTHQTAWAQVYGVDRQPVGDPVQIANHATQPVVASQTDDTFMTAWSTGSQIMGALYDSQGNLLKGPFSLSGDPSQLPLLDPAISPTRTGGYSLAYETDLNSGGSHQVTIELLDGQGNIVGGPVSRTYAPTNPLAPPRIAALEQQLFGSVTVMGVGNTIFAAIVSAPPTGGGGAGVSGMAFTAVSHAGVQPTTATVQVSGGEDGTLRAGSQVATMNDGDVVVVWNESVPNAGTWRIVGQVMTPAGVPVGAAFTIPTALPSNAAASRIALSALPDGGFLVTYDPGDTSLAAQRFDAAGVAVGTPTLLTGTGRANVTTTILSDGTLLLFSDNAPTSGTAVTGALFSLPAIPLIWTGTAGTGLGTAADWDLNIQPDSGHLLQFTLANGGTLTGVASAEAATFSGQGRWVLSGGSVALAQGLLDQSALQIAGGSVTGGGVASIDGSLAVSGAAQGSFLSTAVGTSAGDTAGLTLSGVGSNWTDTGTGGTGGLRVGASGGAQLSFGNVSVLLGAHLTGADVDVFGVTAGSEGDLFISGGGVVSDAGLIIGQAGTALASVSGGTIVSTGSLVLGQVAGGQGAITISGTTAAVTASSAIVVGDAGLGSMTILTGGTVAALGGVTVADLAGAAGSSISVSGAGSSLSVSGLLDIGVAGSGALSLSGGATVAAGSLDAGDSAAAVGQISLSGAGTALRVTGNAIVADDGTGVLSVLNGATFSAANLTIGNLGNSSGALIVSGAGSAINITGSLNIGTALGIGDLTVGPGAAVHASVLNLQGQVVLEGGLLDPTVDLIGQGQTVGGFGTIAAGDIIDEGVIQAGGNKPSQKLLVVDGIVAGGGTLSINGTVQPSSPAGVLQINAGGTMELTGAVLNGSTTFTDDLTPTSTYTIANSVVNVTFADAAGVLVLDAIAGFGGTIASYHAGDAFVIAGGTLSGLGVENGTTLTVHDGGVNAGVGGVDRIIFASAIDPASLTIQNDNTIVACFAEGTKIATTRGLMAVEAIRAGDTVCTVLGGDTAEVVWTGHRKVNCARHVDPRKVWPVVISAHAFGRGMPAVDLTLSPDHAVYVDRVLIPVRLLVNGRTVRQTLVESITYHHIELDRHDIVLANGMPTESYLDTGDRSRFSHGGPVIAMHPDFSARAWEMNGCAPMVLTGRTLASVRRRLAADGVRGKRRPRANAQVSVPVSLRPV